MRQFLGQKRAGRWHRRRSDLSRCVGCARPKKEPAGGNHAPRFCLRLRGKRKVLQRLRPAGGADRVRPIVRYHAPDGGGEPLAGGLRPRRRSYGAGGRRRDTVPAGFRETAGGARRLVRPDCDEHPGAVAAGVRGTAGREGFEREIKKQDLCTTEARRHGESKNNMGPVRTADSWLYPKTEPGYFQLSLSSRKMRTRTA